MPNEIWLAGRIQKSDEKTWSLNSDGVELEIQFSEHCQWSKWSLKAQSRFDVSVLQEGDLVCVRALNHNLGAIVEAALIVAVPSAAPKSKSEMARFNRERAWQWNEFLKVIRDFFFRRGFVEIQTPSLVLSPGTESFLEPMAVRVQFDGQERALFLPTSPEFHLKKVLCRNDMSRIFEIKTCYRNGEMGETHQAEFQMLEWYRAYDRLESIRMDVEDLLVELSRHFSSQMEMKKPLSITQTSMAELFDRHLGFRLTPMTSLTELQRLAEKCSVSISAEDTWNDVFFRIFLERIEPELHRDEPVLVCDYPPSQAALARLTPDGWADRFELYWRGLEIANAFHELNDPVLNRQRFENDLRERQQVGRTPVPLDFELLSVLENQGLPPSGGIALGLDRLFMALFDIDQISETRAFPLR